MDIVAKKKHSELGIASISIVFFDIILWIFLYYSDNYLMMPEWITTILMYSAQGLPIVAFILGICGLFQKGRKKTLPILGIVLSILELVLLIGIVIYLMLTMLGD